MRKLSVFFFVLFERTISRSFTPPASEAEGIWANSCIVSGVYSYFCFVCVILSGRVVGSLPFFALGIGMDRVLV